MDRMQLAHNEIVKTMGRHKLQPAEGLTILATLLAQTIVLATDKKGYDSAVKSMMKMLEDICQAQKIIHSSGPD